MNSEWSSGLKVSLSLHGGLVLLTLLLPHLFPSAPMIPVLPSLKVDLVALPDRQKSEPAPESKTITTPEPTSAPVPQTRREEAIPLRPSKVVLPKETAKPPKDLATRKRTSSALARLRALEAVEDTSAAPSKGNLLSKGTATSGEARENSDSAYFADVLEHVRSRWALPVWLARRKDLTAKVQVYVDARGNLLRMTLVQASGHPVFDERVQSAIKDAQPFPIPPEELRNSVRLFGFVLAFPL